MFNVVLVNPKIPQNTGTIGRTCVSIGATLHIINPLFSFEEKRLRRAGLDYWKNLDVRVYEDLDSFLHAHPITKRHFFATTKSNKEYFSHSFCKNDYLYFGAEDAGLPEFLLKNKEQNMNIPMKDEYRSLNLSNAVSIIVYEALRQNYDDFIR